MTGHHDSQSSSLEANRGAVELVDEGTEVQDSEGIGHARELSYQTEQPPTAIPGYKCLRCLGSGAFGSVWLAREENTGKHVAVKFYTHQRGLDWSLLNREVEKLAVLYTSRNIIGLLDVGWESDPPYYVMEYLENGSLSSHLVDGPLPVYETVRIAKQVLQALVHAHGCGILHCDLKPANVLLDSDYEPRICDFGQSRLSNDQSPALGTLFYMAPEQADLKAIPDARWDVYALGALLYHMLCGEVPYRTPENEELIRSAESLEERLAIYRRILKQSPKPTAHRQMSGVDKRLADIVDRCLEVDPQKRFPNAQAVLDQLELRERQRSRLPLIVLGIVGPTLLMAAIIPIASNAMHDFVQKAESNLTERALESDVLSARILARSIERELEARKLELVELAANPRLRSAVEAASESNWSDREMLHEFLDRKKQESDAKWVSHGREPDTSWFLTDEEGYQRWRDPYNPDTYDQDFSYRDYYHGKHFEYPEDEVPEDIQPIEEPYISVAFRSDATHRYMVAISVPVRSVKDNRVIGLLARTTHLELLLRSYEPSIQGQRDDEVNRVIALVDNRDWKVLDHPWMTSENLGNLSEEAFREKLSFAHQTDLVKKLTRLRKKVGEGDVSKKDDRERNYTDPLNRVNPDRYGGVWLAAFWPVGNAGWTAVVQERKEAALKPVEEMQAGFLRYSFWGLAVGCGLIGTLWYFVNRALSEGNLRLWPHRENYRSSGHSGSLPLSDSS